MSKEKKTSKGIRMPHTFVIIFIIILAAVAFTWLIPAGEYARFENAQGIKVIDPSQFHWITRSPVNPFFITSYIVNAFIKNADLIMVILFSGGAFHIITRSGALQAVIAKLAKKFSNHIVIFIPILSLVFALICTTQAVNMFIAFAPVMVMLALALGLDSICGVAIIILGGAIGFSTGTLNVSTTVISQKIAELPLYSGIGYRFLCFGVFFVVTNAFLIRYANKVRKNPEYSPMYELDCKNEWKDNLKLDDFGVMDARKWLTVACLVVALVVIVYGSVALGWDVAFMMHGAPDTCTDVKCLALSSFDVTYHGKSAHAAIKPEEGRSAFDALMLAFHGIECMREHVRDDVRMHYTMTRLPGPENVVPDTATGRFALRSFSRDYLDEVVKRFLDVVHGAALMAGVTYEIKEAPALSNKIPVHALNDLLIANAKAAGAPGVIPPRERTGSTDFGNVMHEIPGSCIRVKFVPSGTASHSREYIEAGKSQEAHDCILYGAKAIAGASLDLLTEDGLLERIQEEFKTNQALYR